MTQINKFYSNSNHFLKIKITSIEESTPNGFRQVHHTAPGQESAATIVVESPELTFPALTSPVTFMGTSQL